MGSGAACNELIDCPTRSCERCSIWCSSMYSRIVMIHRGREVGGDAERVSPCVVCLGIARSRMPSDDAGFKRWRSTVHFDLSISGIYIYIYTPTQSPGCRCQPLSS